MEGHLTPFSTDNDQRFDENQKKTISDDVQGAVEKYRRPPTHYNLHGTDKQGPMDCILKTEC